MTIDPRLLEILCCPACRNAVRLTPGGESLECAACRRIYPVIDGIPDMLVEDASFKEN